MATLGGAGVGGGVGSLRRLAHGAPILMGVCAALVFWLLAGLVAGVALGILAATVAHLARRSWSARELRRDESGVVLAVAGLVRELRAGCPPGQALANVADAAPGAAQRVLWAMPRGSVQGSGVPAGLIHVTARLATAWELSNRQGVALADLVGAVADDLRARTDREAERDAQLAGPRMSGYLLAALPLLGLVLGAGMGAAPLQILTGSPAGAVLLGAGIALQCAGLLWVARMTAP